MGRNLDTDLSRRAVLFGRRYAEEDDGATAIEYGLIGATIGLVMIVGFRKFAITNKKLMKCANQTVRRGKRGRACDRLNRGGLGKMG